MSNELVLAYNYAKEFDFFDGLALVKQNGKYGFIDSSNNVVVPIEYSKANPFSNELALVERE